MRRLLTLTRASRPISATPCIDIPPDLLIPVVVEIPAVTGVSGSESYERIGLALRGYTEKLTTKAV
jgi:hypothetical protein